MHTLELNADGEVRGPHPDPMLGRKLLHYRVIETIGQGGMSVVYRGVDEHLARDVAIKVLHPFLAEKPDARTRLAREARAVARLEHPHIVKVFDFSGEPPTLEERPGGKRFDHEGFIVAEFVKGPTLKRFCEKHTVWRVPEVGALVVWQLLQALQHAHDNGIIHRDLKPENVMVRDDGCLKLMDFGIAHIADQSGLTVTGTLLGSPAHMAPECIDGHAADARSDLFSLGTVLYWATTGSLPFEALTPHALLKQIVDGRAVPAQQKSARVSDDLARVIARSLQTNPADRYQTAIEFADALAEVIERAGLVVDSESLRRLLDEPGTGLVAASATVRATYLERASRHLEEGQTSRALSCLNRVLADDADDKDARALLDRLHEDDPDVDDTDSGATENPFAVDAAPGALALSVAANGERVESRRTPAAPPTMRWQSFLVGASAVLMVGLAVVVARAIDAAADPEPTTSPGSAVVEEDTSRGAPAAFSSPEAKLPTTTLPADTLRRPIAGLPLRARRPPLLQRADVTPITAPAAVATTSFPVTFRVKPWADIVVDGTVVAKNTLSYEMSLPAGAHTVVFRNPRAKEHEVRFTLGKEGPAPVITARLEPRPALLVVHANVADAFVDVAGAGGAKAAHDTTSRPLIVALDEQSRAEREVFVYKKGYVAYRKRHVFLAGETLELQVLLEPDAVEPASPSPTP